MENIKKGIAAYQELAEVEMGYHEYLDYWVCACGNFEKAEGFMACTKFGNLISPLGATYCRFERCGRIIHVANHTITGINPNPDRDRFTRGLNQ